MKHKQKTANLAVAALCLAGAVVLPQAFHFLPVPNAGNMLLPMHLPVLLCGILCGGPWGAVCGLLAPLLSSLITGMPPLFPVALAMMCELCAYGLFSGFLYKAAKGNVWLSLIPAMLGGRVVMGLANTLFLGLAGKGYSFQAFLTAGFVTSLPGIVMQLVLVPLLVFALKKSRLFPAQQMP